MKKVLLSSVAALAVFAAAAPVFAQGENPSASNQLIQKKYVSWRDAADEAQKQIELHAADIQAEAEAKVAESHYASNLDAAKRALASFSASSTDATIVNGKPVYGPTVDKDYKGTNPQESDVHFQGGNSQDVAAAREQLQANVDAAQKAYDKALSAEVTALTNKYRAQYEKTYIEAAKAQGNYYDETGVEANRTNEQRIADDQVAQGKAATADQAAADQAATADQAAADQAATKPEDGKPGAVDQAKKADAAAKKAGVNAKAGANAKAGQKALPKTHAAK